jgi:hypothetical protein
MSELQSIVERFTNQLASVIEAQVIERAREAVTAALGSGRGVGNGRRGRPPKVLQLAAGPRTRRKGPKQLCPVPGCKNPAAPVFGMVCAKHKDVPRAKIKQYREARRAQKMKGKGGAGAGSSPARRRKRARKAAPAARPTQAAAAAA